MKVRRFSPNTGWVELPSRHAGSSRSGRLRPVAMLGCTCSSRGGRAVESGGRDGVRGTKRASALGVGVPPGARSQAAAVAAPSSRAEPRLAAQSLQPRGEGPRTRAPRRT